MNDTFVQGLMLILTGFVGFIVKTVKEYLFKEGGAKALRIAEILAKNAVSAVEQITDEYTDSEQKLSAAKTRVRRGLENYDIYLTDGQIEMFIESAVKEMNDNWKGNKQ